MMDAELAKQGDELAVRASGLIVVDQATADKADLLISLGKGMIKKIKDWFRPMKQAQDESKRTLLRAEELEILKIEPIVNQLNQSLMSWQAEERRKAREAEEKKLADERRRKDLEDKAIREAQEKERQAKEATERAAREKDETARKEAQEEAAKAQAEADKILAAAATEEEKLGPSPSPAPVIQPMAHSYTRTVWKWRIQQPALVPRDLCKPDDALIDRAVAKAKAQGLRPLEVKLPGVDVWEEIENVRRRT
jgi:hypothetical protein